MTSKFPNKIPTAQARYLVESLYGSPLHNPTYRNWRVWAEVEKRAKWVSIAQLRFMLAIALIRKRQNQQGDNKRELVESEVLEIANSEALQTALDATWDYIEGQGFSLGKDLPERLKEKHNISVSLSTVVRAIDGFSTVKYYKLDDVAELLGNRKVS